MTLDIKKAHRQFSTSAPETDFVRELKQDLEFVSSIEGSTQKKQIALYCRWIGIDYTNLTDVGFEVMMQVLGKSMYLKGQGKKTGPEETKMTIFVVILSLITNATNRNLLVNRREIYGR